jgi:uroporphyrinogen-III decarboxylase
MTLNPAVELNPEQSCSERAKRFSDAICLKKPDRIPLFMTFGYYLAEMGKVPHKAIYEDADQSYQLLKNAVLTYLPDMFLGAWHTPEMSKALGDRMTKWPGAGLEPGGSFQFNEQEFMKADDYDAFLDDPADWAVRIYLPRAFKELEGLASLPPLGSALFGYYGMMQGLPALASPAVLSAAQALKEAARAQVAFLAQKNLSRERLKKLGFPPFLYMTSNVEAPFDFMSDTLRGMRGIFLDMMRIPEKLLAAEEKVAQFQIEQAAATCKAVNMPYVFFPLHRGSDGFMSLKQFETFYWPQLKSMLLELISRGITPWVYYEGTWDQRLKYLAELPPGKTVGSFVKSDIFKVKEILGDKMCIVGGMPNSLLKAGTVEQVRDHTRKVCQKVGEGGGFIMSTEVMELEGCQHELIQAWVDATKVFGSY